MSAAFRPVGRVLMGVALCVGVLVVALKEGGRVFALSFFGGGCLRCGFGGFAICLFMGKTKETDNVRLLL